MSDFGVVPEELILAAQAIYDVANAMAYLDVDADIVSAFEGLTGTASAAAAQGMATIAADQIFTLRVATQSVGDALTEAASGYVASDQAAAANLALPED